MAGSKYLFVLILSFVTMIQAGAFLTEFVKSTYAQSIGYRGEFRTYFGRNLYSSPQMDTAFARTRAAYDGNKASLATSEVWQSLLSEHRRDHAMIELVGKQFTICVSIVGLSLFFYRRRKAYTLTATDCLAVLCGLFFMRDVLVYASGFFFKFLLCDEATLWQHFHLPVIFSSALFICAGLGTLTFVLYNLPRGFRGTFILAGALSSITGTILWAFVIGPLLF